MARIHDAMVQGLEQTMQSVEALAPTPYFSVWCERTLVFPWNKDDKSAGISYLEDNLRALHENKNRQILVIKWHPEQEENYITEKTPVIASLSFRVWPHDPSAYRMNGAEFIESRVNAQLADKIDSLTSQVSALLASKEDPEDDGEDGNIGEVDQILEKGYKLLSHPAVTAMLSSMGVNIPNSNPGTTSLGNIPATSDISDDQKLANALQALLIHDPMPYLADDLQKLANLASKDKAQFNFLINMLRKM